MRITIGLIMLAIVPSMASAQSQKLLKQLDELAKVAAKFSTLDEAKSAGFAPVIGWLPTMGTHWVNGPRMLPGQKFTIATPSQLMFSPVNAQQKLVGVAYAYYAPVGDVHNPQIFDGNPPWHEHANLAPEGMTLSMLHVWFVPSPDGVFAGHNPFLPFWAIGIQPPDTSRMRDPAFNAMVRKAALGIAEVVDTAGMFPIIAKRAKVREVLTEERAVISLMIAELDAADKAADSQKWDRVAAQIGEHWDKIQEAYLKSAVNPQVNANIVAYLNSMLLPPSGKTGHRH